MAHGSEFLLQIISLVATGRFFVSRHGLKELAADGISLSEAISGVADAVMIEYYPDAFKGPSVLVLQFDDLDRPIHLVWGAPKNLDPVAVLITAYRPDLKRWMPDFMERKAQ